MSLEISKVSADITWKITQKDRSVPQTNPAALDFLLTRRSRPAKTLSRPGPDPDTIETLLTAAARTPDHGKLEPWRFIVLEGDALDRLGAVAESCGKAKGLDPAACEKASRMFTQTPCSIAVVASPNLQAKIPEIEQTLSAGAVCLALLNAALASGWGANWLTGWMAFDREWLTDALDLEPHEYVAGFIHIGTERSVPPDRPRPKLEDKVTWLRS